MLSLEYPQEDIAIETVEDVNDLKSKGIFDENEYFFPKSCYICKNRFTIRHSFYDRVNNYFY